MLLYETRSLCKFYRHGTPAEVRAVDDVSLSVERGSLTVVVGASGSGKTTLLAILGTLERPTRGQLVFEGNDMADASQMFAARLRRRMGFVFQDFSLIPNLSVEANITYPLVPRGVPRAERRPRARALLARFQMEDKFAVPARDLSGGEQQRVAIARALIGLPDVLLADEPTSNLDSESVRTLLTIFQEQHAEGKTVLVSSHDPRVLEQATQVVELDKGRLINAGSTLHQTSAVAGRRTLSSGE